MNSDYNPPVLLGQNGNKFYFGISQADLNKLEQLSSGCTVEVNLGKEIELLGGNKLLLSDDLLIDVVLINDKFIEYDNS